MESNLSCKRDILWLYYRTCQCTFVLSRLVINRASSNLCNRSSSWKKDEVNFRKSVHYQSRLHHQVCLKNIMDAAHVLSEGSMMFCCSKSFVSLSTNRDLCGFNR